MKQVTKHTLAAACQIIDLSIQLPKRRLIYFGQRALIVALFLLAACSGTPLPGAEEQAAQVEPTVTPIPTAPAVARPLYVVQRGDVEELLEFTGRWQPRDQLQLAFQIAGTVRRVEVRRGDTVTAGQLLADFQITDLENQLASAQLELQTAQANLNSGSEGTVQSAADAEIALANARLRLDSTKNSSPWTQVASARIQLDSAQLGVDNAQRAYDDARSHPENPASAVDSAYQQLQSAQNQLRSAQTSYDSAAQNFNNYDYNIAEAENAVIQAELNLEKARSGASDPQGAQAVQSAQLRIDQINNSIAQSSLYAPIDGVVLEVTIKPGDQAQAFDTVITIALPEPKEVIASLAFNDAQRMSVGLVGICQEANKPETAVQCAVRQIPASSRDADQTTRIAAALEGLESGQLVDVDMPIQVSQNVLWLPPAAVRTFQNRVFVVLDTPDGPRAVDVEIGLQTDDRVEIKSGVNEGDVVQGP
ncbi:MAG: HlyD family efflux transporter periplasmic adaptor subunit [Anaerolineae bacterium]